MSEKIPHDGTRLGRELQDLEESDPKVKAARARLEASKAVLVDRIRHPDDYVKPENLRIDP